MNTGLSDTGDAEAGALQDGQLAAGLSLALRNTAVSVFYQNHELQVLWAQNVPDVWSGDSIVGRFDSDFLPPREAETIIESKRSVLAGAEQQRLEICLSNPGGSGEDRWFELWIDADAGPDGAIRGVVTTAVETTEQKRRERTLRVLLREVSHRSRNLLAIIQSVATQTGRYSSTVEGFLARFRGRLQSLASSQDLVTSSNWRGADLRELALGQIARYSATPHASLRLEGVRPWLNPNATLHIGLALHELIANSVSYGALSLPKGYANLLAALQTEASGKASLSLEWREAIPPANHANNEYVRERRFGSVALERIVPASLNGSASLRIDNGLLTYRLLVPFGNFEIPHA